MLSIFINFAAVKHTCFTADDMVKRNTLDINRPMIEIFFDHWTSRSFTKNKFQSIFNINKEDWNIPADKNASKVLDYLVKTDIITASSFSDDAKENILIYSWKSQDEFTIISGLKSDSYFAFYTSLFLHQLTLQIPKTIYLNFEHKSAKNPNLIEKTLTQEQIDKAFSGSQRKSSLSYLFRDKKIILTNGKDTGKLGVIKQQNDSQCYYYTDLERTLIDIAVRPVYVGGVFEVLEAYKLAKNKLDVRKLSEYLEKLRYKYPYHQAIGFYLEKANYSESEIELFRKEIKLNFYLTYDIRNKEFSEKWKLYYPKGF